MNNANIFELIKHLTESLPLELAKVAEILGTRLEHNPANDSPVVISYAQAADVKDNPYQAVSVSLPHPIFGSGAGSLGVTLRTDGGIDTKAIFDQYGWDFQRDVPSPRYPPGLPTYYNYEQPWGTLSFGVTNDEVGKLVSFVLKPKQR